MRPSWRSLPIVLLLLSGACASSTEQRAALGAPDSLGLVLLDCQLKFDFFVDSRQFDTSLTIGFDRLRQPIAAQSALYSSVDDPQHLIPAKPNRDLLLLGPLRPGMYYLERVGADREFIESSRTYRSEVVRDPVAFKPGSVGTSRIAFVVEPGGVTYIGRMKAACELRLPEEYDGRLSDTMIRTAWTADDRTWKVTWDRDVQNELVAWERVMVGLKKTPWREPIARRLEFLRAQTP